MWPSSCTVLVLVGRLLLTGVSPSQSVPSEVIDDIDRLLRDRELLEQVVAARIDALLHENPARAGRARDIYLGVPIRGITMDWLVRREKLGMSPAELIGLWELLDSSNEFQEVEDSGGIAIPLIDVSRDVVAGDLADRPHGPSSRLTHLQPATTMNQGIRTKSVLIAREIATAMIRMTKTADYGIVLLTRMAAQPDYLFSTAELSNQTGVPHPTVSKVLKILAREGLLASHRGVNGGYSLTREPHEIPVIEVITALDGPIGITECIDDAPGVCSQESICQVKGNWQRINDAIRSALAEVTLAEMIPTDHLVRLGDGAARTRGDRAPGGKGTAASAGLN